MTKYTVKKYNNACIKLFEFLLMLDKGDVEFKKVIEHFSDGKYDGKSNTHVTLNKYLNAMNIFGVQVKKVKHIYKMLKSPCKLNFSKEDLKCIKLLKEASKILPEGSNKNSFDSFIRSIEIRYDDDTVNKLTEIENPDIDNYEFLNSKLNVQIKLCEKYCQEKYKLEIVFKNNNGETINLLCTPVEINYVKSRVFFNVMGNNGSRIYEIPLDAIISIKQLPSASSQVYIPTTIVYRIKNRLAKNYKLRDWERLDKIENNGAKIIVNKNEDFDVLIKRLMRYGMECEIISPKFIKEEMINRINKTLENYK